MLVPAPPCSARFAPPRPSAVSMLPVMTRLACAGTNVHDPERRTACSVRQQPGRRRWPHKMHQGGEPVSRNRPEYSQQVASCKLESDRAAAGARPDYCGATSFSAAEAAEHDAKGGSVMPDRLAGPQSPARSASRCHAGNARRLPLSAAWLCSNGCSRCRHYKEPLAGSTLNEAASAVSRRLASEPNPLLANRLGPSFCKRWRVLH